MKKPLKFGVGLVAVFGLMAACGSEEPSAPEDPMSPGNLRAQYGNFSFDAVPDFSLADVNESSSTFEMELSAQTFSGKITGWYFGSAL